MSYYSNGNIEMQFYMINGKIEGNFKSYMKNGEITEDSNFVNGKRHGIYKFIDYCQYNKNIKVAFQQPFIIFTFYLIEKYILHILFLSFQPSE